MYEGFNEMQELYNSFEHHSDGLKDHHERRLEATKAYDLVIDWQKYIKKRPEDLPILAKLKLKKIEVIIETWEGICDLVESIIRDGQAACRKRWNASETVLGYLDLALLDPIEHAMPPKLKLEQIEREFAEVKEQIMQMTQLTVEEIRHWIETPLASLTRIDFFLKEWAKIKTKDIASLTCKAQLHLETAKFNDIQDLMNAYAKWLSFFAM